MQIRKASRKQVRLKLAITGVSGAGKTLGALKCAYGLCNDWSKIVVIDTERGSSELYAHLGDFSVLPIEPDYTPEKYIQAVNMCIQNGFEVIIIDSASHEWEGKGGCLEIHTAAGGKFQDWAKVTPRHRKFVETLIQSKAHIICTLREKAEYAISDDAGKKKVEKVGMKANQREGIEYEFDVCLKLNRNHVAEADKDRTELFPVGHFYEINEKLGQDLRNWCHSGEAIQVVQEPVAVRVYTGNAGERYRLAAILKEKFGLKDDEIKFKEIYIRCDNACMNQPLTDVPSIIEREVLK